ncbi:MAG: DUF3618 domain-containing protein [Gemmatimonadaceae bacterium]
MDRRSVGTRSSRPGASAGREAGNEEIGAIREQILDTRERMSATLDELSERLHPRVVAAQLTAEVTDTILDATMGRMTDMARSAADMATGVEQSVVRTIRNHPMPAALIGAGVAWLLWRTWQGTDVDTRASGPDVYDRDTESSDFFDEELDDLEEAHETDRPRRREPVAALGRSVRDTAARVQDRARDVAEHAADRARDVAERVGDGAKRAADGVGQRTRRAAESIARQSKRQARRAGDKYHEHPLAVAALTLAAGFALGITAPMTDREVEVMGRSSSKLADRADDIVTDVADRTERVVDRTRREGELAAEEEGLL